MNGKVAIVTGGASGIGRATVERFISEGASVVIADLNAEVAAPFMSSLAFEGLSDRAAFVRVNVTEEADIAAAVQLAADRFGHLDVICNNAGIGGAFGSIADVDVEDWDETFAVLVRGVFLGIKHAVRQFRAQESGGSIVNTASVAGMSGGGSPAAYAAAKAAVINLTRAASLELAPERIRVNAICPGLINTPLAGKGRADLSVAANRLQPWPDLGEPTDIANAMLFLASDESRFITGEALVVDGGLVAAGPSPTGITHVAPKGWVGMNRGTTGQGATIRHRGAPKP